MGRAMTSLVIAGSLPQDSVTSPLLSHHVSRKACEVRTINPMSWQPFRSSQVSLDSKQPKKPQEPLGNHIHSAAVTQTLSVLETKANGFVDLVHLHSHDQPNGFATMQILSSLSGFQTTQKATGAPGKLHLLSSCHPNSFCS